MANRFQHRIGQLILRPPVKSRHWAYSLILSTDDEPNQPSERLLKLALSFINRAATVDLSDLAARKQRYHDLFNLWPGAHYRLLAAIIDTLKPNVALDIGTCTGMSALAMKKFLPADSKLYTFDIMPWKDVRGTALQDSDFTNQLIPLVDDLSNLDIAKKHASILQEANFILVDTAKDGVLEYKFLHNFQEIGLTPGTIVMFDDIRFWNMLRFWRQLQYPKLDLTSFGNWSGTGLIEWQ